jgi:hypothetical protein
MREVIVFREQVLHTLTSCSELCSVSWAGLEVVQAHAEEGKQGGLTQPQL